MGVWEFAKSGAAPKSDEWENCGNLMKIIVTIIAVIVIAAAGVAALIYSGCYDIGTLNHDLPLVNSALDTGMTRSVQRHAKGINAPALSDPAMIRIGFTHYREMCVSCHGAPGVKPEEIAEGLWPPAPDLAKTVGDWTPAELFWVTKHGIKFTAMPAWGPTHDDDKLWAIVAFLEQLPKLSPEDYKRMEAAAKSSPEGAQH
jgi:mono/diheme cytochrome c family protein